MRLNDNVKSRFMLFRIKSAGWIYLGGSPGACQGRRSAAPQLLPFDCLSALTAFPKEPPPAFLEREMPPQSFHYQSLGMTRFNLVYPLVLFSLWQRACH